MPTYPGTWITASLHYDPITGVASAMYGTVEIFKVVTDSGLTGNAVWFTNLADSATYDTGSFWVDNIMAMLADDPVYEGVGPVVQMVSPAVPAGGSFTDEGGLETVRLAFSEPVGFDASRVSVTNGNGDAVSATLEGSGTRVMTIHFAEPMANDSYTLRVKDSVLGMLSIAPIDGDADGQPGGDYVLTLNHHRRADANADGTVDAVDLGGFAADWLWTND